jgi:galactose mutarotase-like enzyme
MLAATPLSLALRAGPLEAVFLPEQGMTCTSLRHRGEELLHGKGIPLLHPWANRLDGLRYAAAGRAVQLDRASSLLRFDANALPLHGVAGLAWQVVVSTAGQLRARLAWTQPERLAVFPFPHLMELAASLDARGLTLETTLVAGREGPVPVSFGFHPNFALPGVPRARWRLGLPGMRRLALDPRLIPTGDEAPFAPFDGELGAQTFDDGFRLLASQSAFHLRGGGRAITVEFLEGFPYLQLYAPPEPEQVSIEPMTAPTAALSSGRGLALVAPGERYRTAFRVTID